MIRPILPALLLDRRALESIQTAAGVPSSVFQRFHTPLLSRCALFLQQSPLYPDAFQETQGALRFALSLACVSLRVANATVFFPHLGAEQRALLEPQARFAAMAAACSMALVIQTEQSRVVCGQDEYHPLCARGSLHDWLLSHPGATVVWRVAPTPLNGDIAAAIAARFIPAGLLDGFAPEVVSLIFSATTPREPANGVQSDLAKRVRLAAQRVLASESAERQQRYTSNAAVPGLVLPADEPAPISPAAPVSPTPPHSTLSHARANPAVTGIANEAMTVTSPSATNALLATLPIVLQQWFTALASDKGAAVRAQARLTKEGVIIPIQALGKFGASAAGIRGLMEQATLVRQLAEGGRCLLLDPRLSPLF